MRNGLLIISACLSLLIGCKTSDATYVSNTDAAKLVEEYTTITLTTDLTKLSKDQKKMLTLLVEVSDIMDDLYWKQVWGDKNTLLNNINDDNLLKLTIINYGPWNRLNNDIPFVEGIGEKPLGAQYYPSDMTKSEFDKLQDPNKVNHYSIIRRDSLNNLKVIPYHIAYEKELVKASSLLNKAATYAEDSQLKVYLKTVAQSFLDDDYYKSDLAWMDLKNSKIDFVVGPIERYEDQLYGYKNSFEAMILVKDVELSNKIDKIVAHLPELQKLLPVEQAYKSEVPSLESDLAVCDIIYSKGDANRAGKTMALYLPNDPKIEKEKGSRTIYFRNCMKAKFDEIIVPITKELIVPSQQQHVTFDAFFENTMLIEVAHNLGLNYTIDGQHTVIDQLKEHYSVIESGKADVVGLYLINELQKFNKLGGDHNIKDNYVTIMASIFRTLRFGTTNTSGKVNIIRFNYFSKYGAFEKDMVTGKYKVNFDKMHEAMVNLAKIYLTIQGDGDYNKASKLIYDYAITPADLQSDLVKIESAGIPRDIEFIQGKDQLGL
ncbi:Zn-dependent hydrolase [Prolixibacteraceae bacterium]|nr:Zn-dependent hydrolase [Prolixibacteraceae bacterium]